VESEGEGREGLKGRREKSRREKFGHGPGGPIRGEEGKNVLKFVEEGPIRGEGPN
jgi:hypothetical protein